MGALDTTVAWDALTHRAEIGLRQFLAGNLNLTQAAEVAGKTESAFVELLGSSDLRAFRDPGVTVTTMPEGASEAPRVSVVVPLHNEEHCIGALHERLVRALEIAGTYEIVFVDDGSTDASVQRVLMLHEHDANVRLVRLARNFGKEAALAAGLERCSGSAVIVMDADLQDPPEVLPELIRQWEAGAEVVYAVRRKRKESWWKRAGYHAFYRLMRVLSEVEMPLDAGDFCLMDRRVVDVICQLPERNRFMRGLRSWAGFRQVGVEYERPVRHAGEAKFTFRKLVRTAVDGLMAFTSVPLKAAAWLGVASAAAGLIFMAVACYQRLFVGHTPNGWTSLVAIILTLSGTQLIVTGVLGAYIARVYEETKRRPSYVVEGVYDRRGARVG